MQYPSAIGVKLLINYVEVLYLKMERGKSKESDRIGTL